MTLETMTRIDSAQRATAAIAQDIAAAQERLAAAFPVATNAAGADLSPADLHRVLLHVHLRLCRALGRIQATDWPQPADYEEVP